MLFAARPAFAYFLNQFSARAIARRFNLEHLREACDCSGIFA
jgi:hypothetical protein